MPSFPTAGLALALALLLPAPGLAAEPAAKGADQDGKEEKPRERGPMAVLDEVNGTVRAVDRQRQAVTVETAGGPVDLLLDRNTLVYQPGGATTVLAIAPGQVVRAGIDSARRAFWLQLRPPASAPATSPAATPAAAPAPAPAKAD